MKRILAMLCTVVCWYYLFYEEAFGLQKNILLEPPPYTIENLKIDSTAWMCIYLFFEERLAEENDVVLCDENLSRAFFALGSSKEDAVQKIFDRAPIKFDRIIYYTYNQSNVVFTVHINGIDGAIKKYGFTLKEERDIPQIIYKLAQQLCLELKMAESASKRLEIKRMPDEALVPYMLSKKYWTRYPINTGEKALETLKPYYELAVNKTNTYMMARILELGSLMASQRNRPLMNAQVINNVNIVAILSLGTDAEDNVLKLAQTYRTTHLKGAFKKLEADLVSILSKHVDDIDKVLSGESDEFAERAGNAYMQILKNPSPKQYAGAIKAMAALGSEKIYSYLGEALKKNDAVVREAVAFACDFLPEEKVKDLLAKLMKDKARKVALTAAYVAFKKNLVSAQSVSELTVGIIRDANADIKELQMASAILMDIGEKPSDELLAILKKLYYETHDVETKNNILKVLFRYDGSVFDDLATYLNYPDSRLITSAITYTPKEQFAQNAAIQNYFRKWIQIPQGSIREAVRYKVDVFSIQDKEKKLKAIFNLEHPYFHIRACEEILFDGNGRKLADYAEELADMPLRYVLIKLYNDEASREKISIENFKWLLEQGFKKDSVLTKTCAAALLAKHPAAFDKAKIEMMLQSEKDNVIKSYLREALGEKETSQPSKMPFAGKKVMFGMCEYGEEVVSSPFGYYYNLTAVVNSNAMAAAEKGKIMLPRANTVPNHPGAFFVNEYMSDNWWVGLTHEIGIANNIAGIVMGEESMSIAPDALWQSGWRLFVIENGLNIERIMGIKTNLNAEQQAAFKEWANAKAILGFNFLYDLVKIYYTRLNPSFIIGTFLPNEAGANVMDKKWKFDFVGGYCYPATPIEQINTIRRFKTIWQERPVIWLGAGYVYTPAPGWTLPSTKYTTSFATNLAAFNSARAYVDSLGSLIAEAYPAFFSKWLCSPPKVETYGVWLDPEKIYPESLPLQRAIGTMCSGVVGEKIKKNNTPKLLEDNSNDNPILEEEHQNEVTKKANADILKAKKYVETGFLLEKKFLYDIARIADGLPFLHQGRADSLFIGTPATTYMPALVAAHDFLALTKQICDVSLEQYKLIGICGGVSNLLDGKSVIKLDEWLKNTKGVLYVASWLMLEKVEEANNKKLPWAEDIAYSNKSYVLNKNCTALNTISNSVKVALWEHPDYKGKVIFDALPFNVKGHYELLNSITKKHGIALQMAQLPGIRIVETNGVMVAIGLAPMKESYVLSNRIDCFTGKMDPAVGWRSAVLSVSNYIGHYLVATNNIVILSEEPITEVKVDKQGLCIKSSGLIRISAPFKLKISGSARMMPLPAIEYPSDKFLQWALKEKTDGLAILTNLYANPIYFVRSKETLNIQSGE